MEGWQAYEAGAGWRLSVKGGLTFECNVPVGRLGDPSMWGLTERQAKTMAAAPEAFEALDALMAPYDHEPPSLEDVGLRLASVQPLIVRARNKRETGK